MRRFLERFRRFFRRRRRPPAHRRSDATRPDDVQSALEFARRQGQAEERFHVTQGAERDLGGLSPPAIGARPEQAEGGDPGNQRSPEPAPERTRDSWGRSR